MPPQEYEWLDRFVEYAAAQCEAPLSYHKWVGLWTLSCCLQRRVSIPLHDSREYPNLYVTLVGPSARVQKSSAGEIGVELLYHLNDLTLMQDRVTRAYLHAYLAEASSRSGDSCVAIFAPEMKTALSEMTIAEGIMEILTRAHDCPRRLEYRLRGGGVQSATDVWLSMLCCSTPEWLTTGLARDEVGGGFAGRMILVHGDQPHMRMRYAPHMQSRHRNLRGPLLNRMLQVEQMRGECVVEPGAADLWDSMRLSIDSTIREKDARVRPFVNRMHAHALKVACLYSVSRRNTLAITELDMMDAINSLQQVEADYVQCTGTLGNNRPMALADAALMALRDLGGSATRSGLMKMMYNRRAGMTKYEFDTVMEMLEEIGAIVHSVRQSRPGTKMQHVYYLADCAPENLQQQLTLRRGGRTEDE